MSSPSKIKLKMKDSNSNVVKSLERMSNGNFPRANNKNFKLFRTLTTCLMCVLIGICLTPALTQKQNKNVFIRHNQPANVSDVKETAAKGAKCSCKNSKNKSGDKKPKIKKSKKKPDPAPGGGDLRGVELLEDEVMSELHDFPYHSNKSGNSVSNVLNGNLISEEDDWFYYIDYNDSCFIYRTNLKSGETERVLDVACDEICVFKNKLYARCKEIDKCLMTYDFFKKQYSNNVAAGDRFISVGSGCIISCDDSNIYKSYDNDMGSFEKIIIYSGNITKCAMHNDSVYFIESGNLFLMDIDGENQKLLKENVQTFSIENSKIYYLSNNKLYSLDDDVLVSDISMNVINIYNGVVYFSNADDAGKLYSMNLDGAQIKKLSDFCAEKICVTPHKIAIKTESDQVILNL